MSGFFLKQLHTFIKALSSPFDKLRCNPKINQ